MKKLLLLIAFFSISFISKAQTEKTITPISLSCNKYLVKLNSSVTYNVAATITLIKEFSGATCVTFNNVTSYFEIITSFNLDKNVVGGHFQKNATPMDDFLFLGKVSCPAAQSSTISSQ